MLKKLLGAYLLSMSMMLFSSLVCAESGGLTSMGMVTGGPSGTYYQFGLNLKELVKTKGIRLNVHNSNGSVDNIFAVFKRPHTQMGIVQSDVLAFVSKVQTDEVLKKIAKKIKLIYPLYNEEIHLVGHNDILEFEDIEGKRVAIGKEGSGTYLTASLLFKIAGVYPAEIVTIGSDEALAKLKEGAIDAMFYVAGYPVKLFSDKVSREDELRLIPISSKGITEFYPKADIPAGTYDWQEETVNSVAVKSVLVSYNFRNAHCENVGKFASTLAENIGWLKENGHPKWNYVDLEYPLKGWEQYDCVVRYRDKSKQKITVSKEINPVLEAIKDML